MPRKLQQRCHRLTFVSDSKEGKWLLIPSSLTFWKVKNSLSILWKAMKPFSTPKPCIPNKLQTSQGFLDPCYTHMDPQGSRPAGWEAGCLRVKQELSPNSSAPPKHGGWQGGVGAHLPLWMGFLTALPTPRPHILHFWGSHCVLPTPTPQGLISSDLPTPTVLWTQDEKTEQEALSQRWPSSEGLRGVQRSTGECPGFLQVRSTWGRAQQPRRSPQRPWSPGLLRPTHRSTAPQPAALATLAKPHPLTFRTNLQPRFSVTAPSVPFLSEAGRGTEQQGPGLGGWGRQNLGHLCPMGKAPALVFLTISSPHESSA